MKKLLLTLLVFMPLLNITNYEHHRLKAQSVLPPPISISFENLPVQLETQEEAELESEEIEFVETEATILSFGDTLCHKPLFNAAYDKESNTYDFSYMFEYITPYFDNADMVIGNCESPMAGSERGYSGYPTFNAPEHLAIDLKELGVDIMSTANNHALDKGFSGLNSTLDFLDTAGIYHVGTARSLEEKSSLLFMDLNGIRTCFLSYTYGTNGIPIPDGKEFCINLIDKELMLQQINQAKLEGAEFIVVSIHWGIEYQTKPNKEQLDLAEFLIANDVNLILGSHPHVLQPAQFITVEKENCTKEGLVIFSQGNFFSNQTKPNTQNTALFQITLKKDSTGVVNIDEFNYIPIYVYRKAAGTPKRYQLLDLNSIINSYESNENTWSESMYNLALKEKERCVNIIEN